MNVDVEALLAMLLDDHFNGAAHISWETVEKDFSGHVIAIDRKQDGIYLSIMREDDFIYEEDSNENE